jgi:hypothetical protein
MLSQFVYSLSPGALAILVLATTSSVALFFLWFFTVTKKYIDLEGVEDTHQVYSSAFNVAFAILLGMLIATSWSAYNQTNDNLKSEINYVNDLFKLAEYLQPEQKNELRDTLRGYVHHMIDDEWPLLPLGQYSPTAINYLFRTFDILYRITPVTPQEQFAVSEMRKTAKQLIEKRRERIYSAGSSISPVMWTILISCTILSFCILGLGAYGNFTPHLVLQSLYGFGVGLLFFLLIILDRPFYYGIYYGSGISFSQYNSLLTEWQAECKYEWCQEKKRAIQAAVAIEAN